MTQFFITGREANFGGWGKRMFHLPGNHQLTTVQKYYIFNSITLNK
jgi:hypothetical protein